MNLTQLSCNKRRLLQAALWAFTASFLQASVGGRIEGTVSDATGAIIQNAEVTAVNAGTAV